jgi:drug/metabolite transporter (DMT)-like permease
MPKAPRRPDPPPLDTDDRPLVVAGMVLWAVAFVVLVVFFRDDLHRHHASYWIWSCLIGLGLGLYALRFVSRRQRNR